MSRSSARILDASGLEYPNQFIYLPPTFEFWTSSTSEEESSHSNSVSSSPFCKRFFKRHRSSKSPVVSNMVVYILFGFFSCLYFDREVTGKPDTSTISIFLFIAESIQLVAVLNILHPVRSWRPNLWVHFNVDLYIWKLIAKLDWIFFIVIDVWPYFYILVIDNNPVEIT